jgi:selenocysteine lyase/cysteine desulfurase
MEGAKRFINLDNSASTPTFSPIWNAFRQAWLQRGVMQQEISHEVKNICAEVLGAPLTDYDVLFTSNATEAINLTAESLGHESDENTEPVILNTLLEHSSNDLPWRMVPHHTLIRLPVNAEGFINLNALEALLCSYNQKNQYGKKRIKLVAVSGASNVLGVCNNIEEISQIAHRYGARLLVDAAQLVAHRKIDMKKCGIDYLAFSAHKVYAPFGCGVLVARKGLLNFTSPEFELIRSSGEENTGGIAALGKSLILLQKIGMDLIQREEQNLTRQALRGLSQIPGIKIYGIKDPESSEFMHKIGVIVFALKGIMPARIAKELAIRGGIGVRSGCHCAHILIKYILHVPPFFQGFQGVIQKLFPGLKLPGLVRVSLGIENSEEDVDKFIQVLHKINKHKLYTSDNHGTSGHKENPSLWKENVIKQMNDFVQTTVMKVYVNPK